jgi:class 3 adenylate cyclase/tetratricopeptide (TPR) repeat protein
MPICERCASLNPAGFRFCGACGAPLGEAELRHETRKVVTVLFSDATGWTSLSESRDPEALRAIMSRYFKEIRQTIERHGGTVEKFIGDAVMAVFGVPRLHEDDALRAVRAAAEIRERLPSVAEAVGVTLKFRTGVNTGMVFTGEGESLAVGDAVNVAARLEQAAEPGEILLGEETFRLVADRVQAAPLHPVTMKGKAEPVPAFRLLGLRPDQTAARPMRRRPQLVPPTGTSASSGSTPLVGRARELASAQAVFTHTAAAREPHLLTVVGEAGIGKSRLVQELIGGLVDQALVLVGRCLSYGEGIAFWPLREALTQAAGGESRDAIRTLLTHAEDADLAADVISSTLGLTPAEPVSEQVPWAFQRLLETPRRQRSMLLVIEDAHWAEDPLLELLEYLVRRLTAPALVLCLARPELLDRRPAWRGEGERFSSLSLAPLDPDDARRLLGGGEDVREDEATAILRAAEGNPLFVEQLLAMRADEGWARERIPVTIQSLLAARLDRLSRGERALIERAAVIGREFPAAAVTDLLSPAEQSSAAEHLGALTTRGLIGPAESTLAGENQLGFRHILIRDVAYHSTAKALRADLHERFASWLERSVDGYGEFVGYHLEQAVRHRIELGDTGDPLPALADRAGHHLYAVGANALARGDASAGAQFLRRSQEMFVRSGHPHPDVLVDLGTALADRGDYDEAQQVLQSALASSRAAGDEALAARASIELSFLTTFVDPEGSVEQIQKAAEVAIPLFERVGDEAGLARALGNLAHVHWTRCSFAEMEAVLERALWHADRAGATRERLQIINDLACATVLGPRAVADGIARCTAMLEETRDHLKVSAYAETMLAVLEAMDGRFDAARERWQSCRSRLTELGHDTLLSLLSVYAAWIELLAGTPANAEPELREAYRRLEELGEQGHLATLAAFLGRVLWAQGRNEEALSRLEFSGRAAASDDVVSQVLWRGTLARVLARGADPSRADELSLSAVASASQTDFLMLHADALSDRADVLAVLERPDESARAAALAAELYARKGMRASSAVRQPA